MTTVQFETKIDEHGNIHVPQEVAEKLGYGVPVRVSIAPAELPKSDEAWQAILKFVHEHISNQAEGEPYQWRREDAYQHLDEK